MNFIIAYFIFGFFACILVYKLSGDKLIIFDERFYLIIFSLGIISFMVLPALILYSEELMELIWKIEEKLEEKKNKK